MKKLFTILTVFAISTTITFAQDLTSKKGENYLPETDEWSIGYDATSLLNYVGNFLNSNATAPTVSSPYGTAAYGKKMIDDHSAWRVRLEFGSGSNSVSTPKTISYNDYFYDVTQEVVDNNGNLIQFGSVVVDSEQRTLEAIDKRTNSNFDLAIWLGKEWRRGSTRLQGVYGAEVGFGLHSLSTSYEYGHDASIWARDLYTPILSRIEEVKSGSAFTLASRAFIGAEYFVLPKISLGVEYGWGIGISSQGKGSTTLQNTTIIENKSDWEFGGEQKISPDTYSTISETVDTGSSSSFKIGHDLRGTIAINLYF